MWGKLGNTTSAYYSSHISRANADVLGFGPGDDSFGDDIGSDDGWEDSRNEELNNEYSNKQAEKDTENNEISSGIAGDSNTHTRCTR